MSLIQITKNIFIDPKQVSSLELCEDTYHSNTMIGNTPIKTPCNPYLKIAMKGGESFTIYTNYKEVFDKLKPLMEAD